MLTWHRKCFRVNDEFNHSQATPLKPMDTFNAWGQLKSSIHTETRQRIQHCFLQPFRPLKSLNPKAATYVTDLLDRLTQLALCVDLGCMLLIHSCPNDWDCQVHDVKPPTIKRSLPWQRWEPLKTCIVLSPHTTSQSQTWTVFRLICSRSWTQFIHKMIGRLIELPTQVLSLA